MTIIQALILGIVQGIAEMLPISSSAHLVLFPWLFNFPDPGLSFDVALHIGTLAALLVYFWQDWVAVLKGLLRTLKTRKIEVFEQKLFLLLIVATIPGALAGYFFESAAETVFRSPVLIALALSVMGALLYFADSRDKGLKKLKDTNYRNAFTYGLAQALAIVPGVSRSGVTMTTGLFLGFERESVAKFSFLMSAPIIAGAGIFQLKDLSISELSSAVFIVGFLASLVSSFLAIKFLLGYIKNHNFKVFAYYRFILAAIIILLVIFRG